MVRSIDAIEKRVQQLLGKQEIVIEKERAKEAGMKPKKDRAITAAQILSRFEQMPVRLVRPQLIFSLTWCLDEEEKVELQNLIDTQDPMMNLPQGSKRAATSTKPVGRLPSKRKRPISVQQINERFQQMRSNRPALVFTMSKCLTPREKRKLQDLVDSAFRARSFEKADEK